jgi:hypothetical protein
MALQPTVLYFRVLHSHFGLAKKSTSIFFGPKIIQFKMESIFKMAILSLSICSSEPCIFAILKPTIFKVWILIEEYIRIKDTFGFFDLFTISSEIELGLGPSQIKIF